jgi:hypothetical protein
MIKHKIKDIVKNEYHEVEANVYFNLFKKDISISSYEDDIEYIQSCADLLNSFDEKLIEQLCLSCIRYCNAVLNFMDEPIKKFDNIRDVLKLIYPSVLLIPETPQSREPVVHMELNCQWEIEHGMEWVIRGDKILFVSSFNGEDPWRDFDDDDDFNFA